MSKLLRYRHGGESVELTSPTALPRAGTFLWNQRHLLQISCRGFATARYLQEEIHSYSRSPVLEAETFMQPEQPHFAHHPGRFF